MGQSASGLSEATSRAHGEATLAPFIYTHARLPRHNPNHLRLGQGATQQHVSSARARAHVPVSPPPPSKPAAWDSSSPLWPTKRTDFNLIGVELGRHGSKRESELSTRADGAGCGTQNQAVPPPHQEESKGGASPRPREIYWPRSRENSARRRRHERGRWEEKNRPVMNGHDFRH